MLVAQREVMLGLIRCRHLLDPDCVFVFNHLPSLTLLDELGRVVSFDFFLLLSTEPDLVLLFNLTPLCTFQNEALGMGTLDLKLFLLLEPLLVLVLN